MSRLKLPSFIFLRLYSIWTFKCWRLLALIPSLLDPGMRTNNLVSDWQDYNGYHNNGDVIGIELGSTFSRVGVIQGGEGGQFTLIPNDKGENRTTSCVAFTDNGVLVGSEASERLLGRMFSDQDFVEEIKTLPYEVVESWEHGVGVAMVKVTINGTIQLISPEKVASHMMAYLKKSAGLFLGYNVWTAVTTYPGHPIYSGDAKYQALKDAGTIAGLEIKRVVNEPQAAAIAHGLEGLDGEHNILTYSIGANKTEVMLLNVDRGVWEVLSSVTNPYVGGKTFETAFLDYMSFEVIRRAGKWQSPLNLIANAEVVSQLEDELSRDQTMLLAGTSTAIELRLHPFMMPSFGDSGFVYTVTQTELLESYRQVFSISMRMVDRVFIEAEGGPLQVTQIDDVIMIGSPDHIAMVQSFMEERFGADRIRKNVPFDEAVVRGAAIQGSMFSGVEDTLCSLTIPGYVPLSIGIEILGGMFTTIIERNTVFPYGPVYKSRTISTVNDNQPKIEINVFEGQRRMAVDNSFLGAFVIDGVPPAPKGVPQIEILFQYDEDDVLTVFARLDGKSIDRENTLVIRVPYREDQTQVDEVISDADKHREEDLAAVKMAFETGIGKLEQELAFSCKQCEEEVSSSLPTARGIGGSI